MTEVLCCQEPWRVVSERDVGSLLRAPSANRDSAPGRAAAAAAGAVSVLS